MSKFIALIALILISFLLIFLRGFFSIVTVKGLSMSPTLRHGDRVLVCHLWPFAWLKKYQIVLIDISNIPSIYPLYNKPLYIKRVIGLPSDLVKIHLSEIGSAIDPQNYTEHYNREWFLWNVPSKHFFVKGDGISSIDSTVWGPLPALAFAGIVIARLSPHDNE